MNESEISDLDEVYRLLQRDAADLLQDLLSGITVWRFNAWVAWFLAAMGTLIGVAYLSSIFFGTPWVFPRPVYFQAAGPDPSVAKFKMLLVYSNIAAVALGSGALAAVVGEVCRRKYVRMRRQYSELFAIAKKLR